MPEFSLCKDCGIGSGRHLHGCLSDPATSPATPATNGTTVTAAPASTSEHARRKAAPLGRWMVGYFPLALMELAKLSLAANDQHNPGEPMHWARDKSTDHLDCAARHLLDAGKIDNDGERHTAKMAWRALALLQEELENENASR